MQQPKARKLNQKIQRWTSAEAARRAKALKREAGSGSEKRWAGSAGDDHATDGTSRSGKAFALRRLRQALEGGFTSAIKPPSQAFTVTVRKITIWTDSSNTFDIFNSLRALPLYNEILKSAVDVLLDNSFKLRVLLLPGKTNVVADALSRWRNDIALANYPELLIDSSQPLPSIPYKPPRDALGADKK
ncbi:hypothetical protein B0H15DRAFT_957205 [Mycena belliarum]|uniref:Uncharacterized protein n=1 Tax=Mycena belliarum TaxID=1033014 RepID=A0AAD6TRH0_9AGAR|nr:hypothetical protein B0H15DRAFT_957205 [Mycena belliae]